MATPQLKEIYSTPRFSPESLYSDPYARHLLIREIEDLTASTPRSCCDLCGGLISWGVLLTTKDRRCENCGEDVFSAIPMEPTKADRVAVRSGEFFEGRFYHVTYRSQWGEDVLQSLEDGLNPILHAGDRSSALYRGSELDREIHTKNRELYLYSFELTRRAKENFIPLILQDAGDDWPEDTEDPRSIYSFSGSPTPKSWFHCAEPSPRAVGAYVNTYEVAGNLSILFTGDSIEIDSLRRETLDRTNSYLKEESLRLATV